MMLLLTKLEKNVSPKYWVFQKIWHHLTGKYYRNLIVKSNEIQQVLMLTKTKFIPVNLNKKFKGT